MKNGVAVVEQSVQETVFEQGAGLVVRGNKLSQLKDMARKRRNICLTVFAKFLTPLRERRLRVVTTKSISMNKLVVSVGIIALGSSVLHAVETGALNAQQTKKAWSVSASLRGFYDDNFNSQSGANKQSSTGIEISPSIDFGVAGEQSSFDVGYDLTARYYEKAVSGSSDHSDFTHNFNATATHALSEQVRLNANEQFVVGQEPDLQRGPIDNPQHISGDNVRNYATVGANIQATTLLGFQVSYNNTLVDYDDEGPGSNSARLDRMEHGVNLGSKWTLSPQSAALFGARLGKTEYLRKGELADTGVLSTSRNNRSLILYGGAEHEFNNTLSGSLLIGGQRTTYPNNPNTDSKWSPWVESSLDYEYQTQTKFSFGFSYSRSASDLVAPVGLDFVRDTETASVYASVKHEIAAHLNASGSIRYQSAKFNGGSVDGKKDNFLLLGLGLAYEFNPNLEGNIGYNFDDLSSDSPGRSYNRNKFYVGVTAKY